MIGEEIDENRHGVLTKIVDGNPGVIVVALRHQNSWQNFLSRRRTKKKKRNEKAANQQFVEILRWQIVEIIRQRTENEGLRRDERRSKNLLDDFVQMAFVHSRQTIEQFCRFDKTHSEKRRVSLRHRRTENSFLTEINPSEGSSTNSVATEDFPPSANFENRLTNFSSIRFDRDAAEGFRSTRRDRKRRLPKFLSNRNRFSPKRKCAERKPKREEREEDFVHFFRRETFFGTNQFQRR